MERYKPKHKKHINSNGVSLCDSALTKNLLSAEEFSTSDNKCGKCALFLTKPAKQKKSTWFSVTEILPDSEVICFGHGEYLIGFLSDDFTCESEGVVLEGVTHWQPLPEPPK